MEDFDYFTYGKSTDPAPQSQYALYHPIFKCFLILTHTRDLAWQLKSLLSSRYLVGVVCISSAKNYSASMIDNTCCEKWTMSNSPPDVRELLLVKSESTVENLLPAIPQGGFDIEKEKKWAQMCLYWLRVFDRVYDMFPYGKIDFLLNGILDLKELTYIPYELVIEIKKILYLETDFVTAEQSILDIIKKNPILTMSWDRYKNTYHA
jgi:hypothetical protein